MCKDIEKMKVQYKRYLEFKKLHESINTFILPNAWDVNSAKLFEYFGFNAIGTTSAGIAASLGFKDGENLTFSNILQVSNQIINSVEVPVTVDIESGFGETTNQLAQNIEELIGIGAAGIYIEDSNSKHGSILDINEMKEKLTAIKKVGDTKSCNIFINAKIDLFWLGAEKNNRNILNVIERANSYFASGADCVFIPSIDDETIMRKIIKEVKGPTNFLLGKGTPNVSKLSEMGVKRISTGSAPMRKVITVLKEMCSELKNDGSFEILKNNIITCVD